MFIASSDRLFLTIAVQVDAEAASITAPFSLVPVHTAMPPPSPAVVRACVRVCVRCVCVSQACQPTPLSILCVRLMSWQVQELLSPPAAASPTVAPKTPSPHRSSPASVTDSIVFGAAWSATGFTPVFVRSTATPPDVRRRFRDVPWVHCLRAVDLMTYSTLLQFAVITC